MLDKSVTTFVEPQLRRQMLRRYFWLVAFGRRKFANRDRLCPRIRRLVEALLRKGQAARRVAVIGHLADTQMVILKDFKPALLLCAP